MDVQIKLNEWRTEIKARDFPGIMYASSMVLKDETIALLASVGPITSQQHLQQILSGQWLWIDEYGGALYQFMSSLSIPKMKPLPKKTRAPKHSRAEPVDGGIAAVEDVGQTRPTARRRVNVDASTQPLIPASSPAEFSHAGSSNSIPTTQRRGQRQTVEELRAEFAQLPVDPKFASLFTRSNQNSG
jgi:hypothetical protein